jgi:hypothetical protein
MKRKKQKERMRRIEQLCLDFHEKLSDLIEQLHDEIRPPDALVEKKQTNSEDEAAPAGDSR